MSAILTDVALPTIWSYATWSSLARAFRRPAARRAVLHRLAPARGQEPKKGGEKGVKGGAHRLHPGHSHCPATLLPTPNNRTSQHS